MSTTNRLTTLALVVPIFNEEDIIERLHREVVTALETLEVDWQVIYVDDGSTDHSLELLRKEQSRDPRTTIVELSRNWGHQPAITAGLSCAEADAIVLMDGDLQDPPSVIPELVKAWRNGAQVVIAERRSRGESWVQKFLFSCFYRVLGFLSDYPIPLNAGIFGLLDRQAVNAVKCLSETNRYLPGLRAWVGFTTAVVYYDRADRAAGKPKQTFTRLLRYALNAIFSFSYKPLQVSLAMGLGTAFFAAVSAIILVVCRVLNIGLIGPVVSGYTSTIVAVLFIGGVQLISIGILGEYVGRIYDEVKRRPLFFVRQVHRPSITTSARSETTEVAYGAGAGTAQR